MQAWRNAFQSQLSKEVSVSGVTLARFMWAGPIALVYLYTLYQWQPTSLPNINREFAFFAFGAAIMQIIATGLMVKLFQMKNYAIGAGLAKSEGVVAACLGVLFFGTELSLIGWSGVLLGGFAIFYMSTLNSFKAISLHTMLLGIACGSAFALTSLWVREASLTLSLPFLHSAAWVLSIVIITQTILLLLYLVFTDPKTLSALMARPKLVILTSVSSCLGSIGWFSAMSLQAVPYVKTLGQIEVFFTMLIGALWLKDPLKIKSIVGLLLIALAAVLVIWG
ncbi:Permeases of the drug/metabolite transporter (DMT) superfamily [Pseudoalteromonas luteoviolacea B = ATCC 29581]|nr:Permeases of the drug/metabolite transporter (DMT) superfamily [Pseudoalteromonas luteoviolacea B = ATCC 29581]